MPHPVNFLTILRCAGFGTKAFRPLRPATPDMNSPYLKWSRCGHANFIPCYCLNVNEQGTATRFRGSACRAQNLIDLQLGPEEPPHREAVDAPGAKTTRGACRV